MKQRGSFSLAWQSLTLVILLAATWLIVGASLQEASSAIVSAGRTGFTVLGLLTLTWWAAARAGAPPHVELESAPHVERPTAPTRYTWREMVLLAFSGVVAYTVLSTLAINLAGPALPTLVMALTPAVVLLAEAVLNRKSPPMSTIVGTGVAVAGAVIYLLPRLLESQGTGAVLGSVLAFAAMLSMAFYVIYFARVNRNYQGPMAPRILPVFALGTVPLAAWALVGLAHGDSISVASISMLAFLGIVVYVPVYLLQHRILLKAGPSYSALLGLATPVLVGLSSAALHLAAMPTPIQFAGMALTLCGMYIVIRRKLGQPEARRNPNVTAQE